MWKSVFLLLYITLLLFNLIKADGNVTMVKPTTTETATNTETITTTTTDSQIELLMKESSIQSKLETLKKVTHRIVNGTSAVLGQFPHQVSLRRSPIDDHFCGGSILTPKWVLSAAHCVTDENGINVNPRKLWVVAGDIYIKYDEYPQDVSIVKGITIHPEFDYNILHNDVSLLELETPICFNNRIHSLPLARAPTSANTVCQVSGWGYQFSNGVISKNLLYVNLPVVDIYVCKILLGKYVNVPDKGVMCAGYMEGGRDACQGDSGGGMVCSGMLTGIVSAGLGCALPRLPGLYADIHVYTDWIEKFVNLKEEVKFCSSSSSLASSLFALVSTAILHANRWT